VRRDGLGSAGTVVTGGSSDRAVQDRVIRALADARYRVSSEWLVQGLADQDQLERYARFLARHFYYERLVQFFKYSRALARVTGRQPETVLTQPGFDALLPGVVLGSRETARAVAGLAVAYVAAAPASIPYLTDLLSYEEAMMVVEAGPRVWRDQEPGVVGRQTGEAPTVVEGTVILELTHDLPAVLPELLRPWTALPLAPERPTTLLVARSPYGRVAVARSDTTVAALVRLADGEHSLAQLAAHAGLEVRELEATVRGLVELGALRFATGS
jgi:hypothetical protein